MFENDGQRCEAILVLLASLRLERLWTMKGPTDEACELLEQRGGYLSSGERLLLFVAFDMWNGDGHADFGRLLYSLDGERQTMVGLFLIAMAQGSHAIDQWIEAQR
jgi:hypothetical protein